MGRSVIRVVANGLQYGAWQGSYGSPSVTVLDGTAGNLLDDGPDGYVVQWDQAFRQDPDSPDGSLERLDGVAVFSEKTPSNSMLIGPFSVTSIIDQEEQDDQDDLDRHTIGPDEPEPIRTTGPQLAQFACDVMDAVNRLRDGVEPTAQVDDDPPPDGDLFEQADGDPLPAADIDGIVAGQYDEEPDTDDPARLLTAAAGSMQRFAETIVILSRQIARLAEEDSDAE